MFITQALVDTAIDNISSWTEVSATVVAPLEAAKFKVVLNIQTTTVGQKHWVSNISVSRNFPYNRLLCALSRQQTVVNDTSWALKLKTLGNNAMEASTRTNIVPGKQYLIGAKFKCDPVSNPVVCEIRVGIYDSSNNLLRFVLPTYSTQDVHTGWTEVWTTIDAPNGAAIAEPQFFVNTVTSGQVHYVSDMFFKELPFIRNDVVDTGTQILRGSYSPMQIRKAALDKINDVLYMPSGQLLSPYVVQAPADLNQWLTVIDLNAIQTGSNFVDYGQATLSGGVQMGGVFLQPEWVISTFNPRKINRLDLYTTEGYPNMSNVTLQYFDSDLNQWVNIATNYSLINDIYYYKFEIGSDKNCSGLRGYVNGTVLGSDYARLSELQGIYYADISDDVSTSTIKQNREDYINTVPVGMTKADTLDLVLQNVDQDYSPDVSTSKYFPYITANNKFTISLGIDTTMGIEYTPMGVFYTDDWNVSGDNLTATAQCRDFAKFAQDEKLPYFGKIWTNVTMGTVMRDIMCRMGFAFDEIIIDPTVLRIFPTVFLKDKIIWQFMAEIGFADQGMYGWDELGRFFYQNLRAIELPPYVVPD